MFATSPETVNMVLLQPHKHVFLMFYGDGCGYCIQAKPEWEAVAKHVSSHKNVAVFAVEGANTDAITAVSDKSMQGVPTFIHYFNKKRVGTFEGDRKTAEFVNWILKSSGNKTKKNGGGCGGGRTKRTKRRQHHKRKTQKQRHNK